MYHNRLGFPMKSEYKSRYHCDLKNFMKFIKCQYITVHNLCNLRDGFCIHCNKIYHRKANSDMSVSMNALLCILKIRHQIILFDLFSIRMLLIGRFILTKLRPTVLDIKFGKMTKICIIQYFKTMNTRCFKAHRVKNKLD